MIQENKQVYICDPAKNKGCQHRGCLTLGRGECCMTFNPEYSKPRRKSTGQERAILREARKMAKKAAWTIAPLKR